MSEEIQFEIIKKGFGYKILTFLYNNRNKKDIYGSVISKNSSIAETNISPVLKKLEKLKLIKREINSKSKRVKYLSLTNEGAKLAELLLQIDTLIEKQKLKIKARKNAQK